MAKLAEVSAAALRTALDSVDEKKPTQRLMVAIAHKHGVPQTKLADWYGIERKTIYNWLSRFEEHSDDLVEAARDDPRPGRPRKLSPTQRAELERTLDEPPVASGYEVSGWTPELLRRHIRETFDRVYSLGSCRRLLREAGLRYDPDRGHYTRRGDTKNE